MVITRNAFDSNVLIVFPNSHLTQICGVSPLVVPCLVIVFLVIRQFCYDILLVFPPRLEGLLSFPLLFYLLSLPVSANSCLASVVYGRKSYAIKLTGFNFLTLLVAKCRCVPKIWRAIPLTPRVRQTQDVA